jgi:hypothetical protein
MGRGPMDMVASRVENSNVPVPLGQRGYSGSGTGSFPVNGFPPQSPAGSSLPSFVGRGSAPGMSLADSANTRLQSMNNFLSSRLPPAAPPSLPPTVPPSLPPGMEFPTPIITEPVVPIREFIESVGPIDPNEGEARQEVMDRWYEDYQRAMEVQEEQGSQYQINNPGSIPVSRGFDEVSDDLDAYIPPPVMSLPELIDETGINMFPDGITFRPPPTQSIEGKEQFSMMNPEHFTALQNALVNSNTTLSPALMAQMNEPGFDFSSLGPGWTEFGEQYYITEGTNNSPSFGPILSGFASGGLVKNYSNGGLAQMQGISPGGLGDTVVMEQAASGPGGSSISEEMFSVEGLSSQPTLQEIGSKLSPQQMQLVVREIKMAIAGQHPQAEMVIEAARQMFGDQFLEEIALSMAEERLSMQGDGMSDSIPASLGQEQVALSEGEYVVPADTVADLGNGSTEAGGRAMDRMVQEVRMQTRGTPVQRPAIDPRDFMPGRGV